MEHVAPGGRSRGGRQGLGARLLGARQGARLARLLPAAQAVGIKAVARAPARALLIAGRPLRESIAQYGPFVMNTQQEILTAIEDYRSGKMG